MLVPLRVEATKWGICVHKVGYSCTQSGVFVGATHIPPTVFEWCLDWWEDNIATTTDSSGNLYNGRVNINPASPTLTLSNASGTHRVMKGGATTQGADNCRPAYRFKVGASTATKITGLRVACQAGLQ